MTEPAAWPFQEARKVKPAVTGPTVFEAGFGPSGLPHIGTFAEVARSTFVLRAFETLTGKTGSLYAFCDDMDGLRRVPKNLPPEKLAEHLGRPLSRIPDPFGCCHSYSGHMEKKLQDMLDAYGLAYTLKSSSEEYRSGVFNPGLRLILQKAEDIKSIIIPTLLEKNRERWSPFLPICSKCGRLYTTRVVAYYPENDSVGYVCDWNFGDQNQVEGCGHKAETSVLDGSAKVGWKVDWALRWFAYNVAYEMFGKDLIDSAKISGKIVRLLGGTPPQGMTYEMFLNEDGKKISKSVGEGIAVEQWLRYAPLESMLYYLYQNPKKQRRLYFDVIPKSVDDYLAELSRYPSFDQAQAQDSVVWHVARLKGQAPTYTGAINYSLVLNLIEGLGAADPQLLYDYLLRYDPKAVENRGQVETLISAGLNYFHDFIEPHKQYKTPDESERSLLKALHEKLAAHPGDDADAMQSLVFDLAREIGREPAQCFKTFYQVVLGQERGPRLGTFVKLVGKDRVLKILYQKITE